MTPVPDDDRAPLRTSVGEVALDEYRLAVAGRELRVLHTGAVLSHADEQRYLSEERDRMPYGVVLWPAAIALAHDVAARGGALRGRRVLELGAGTGLPGIVAATLGARVVQTDRHELAMVVCRRNGARNGAPPIEYRLADWSRWREADLYDFIIGSDLLYAEAMHPHLRGIFESNLAPGGRVLLSDPFRPASLRLLEPLAASGWAVALTRWSVGEEADPRAVGVYELSRPDTDARGAT